MRDSREKEWECRIRTPLSDPQALDFLLELFKKGLGYSALNTARSALLCIIAPKNMVSFGSQPLVVRFLKGVYESRPSVPQYVETWDVKVVLKFLANQHPPTKLSLKQLTLKLVMLVSLVSGQRGQSIQLLDINCMSQTETTCSFVITQNVKQSRPGTKQPVIKLEAYPIDERLCVVTLLKDVGLQVSGENIPSCLLVMLNHLALYLLILLVVGLRQLCRKPALIRLSLSRKALVQPPHPLLNEMQSPWKTY